MSDPLFTKDTKGDKQNVTYGRPDKYAIPNYRPAGQGFLVGLGRDYRLSKSVERHVLRTGIDIGQRSRHQSLLVDVDSREDILLTPTTGVAADGLQTQLSYVSLDEGPARKRRRLSEGAQPIEEDDSSSSGEDQSPSSVAIGEDLYRSFQNDPLQARQRRLRDQISQEPESLEAWLALVDLQQEMVTEQNGKQYVNTSQRRLVTNLRLSIFEDALSKVQDPLSRMRLAEGFMREGAKVWDSSKQNSEWQRLLKDSQSFEVRKLYISFIQSNVQHFTVDAVVEAYRWQRAGARFATHLSASTADAGSSSVWLRGARYINMASFARVQLFPTSIASAWQRAFNI